MPMTPRDNFLALEKKLSEVEKGAVQSKESLKAMLDDFLQSRLKDPSSTIESRLSKIEEFVKTEKEDLKTKVAKLEEVQEKKHAKYIKLKKQFSNTSEMMTAMMEKFSKQEETILQLQKAMESMIQSTPRAASMPPLEPSNSNLNVLGSVDASQDTSDSHASENEAATDVKKDADVSQVGGGEEPKSPDEPKVQEEAKKVAQDKAQKQAQQAQEETKEQQQQQQVEEEEEEEVFEGPGKEITHQGEWKGSSAGGCFNSATWRNNPQYFLSFPSTSTPSSSPVQVAIRLQQSSSSSHFIGFYVLEGNSAQKAVMDNAALVNKSSFDDSPSVEANLTLAPRENGYVVIPATFDPLKEASFSISVSASSEVFFERPSAKNLWYKQKFLGEWVDDTAGGCRNFPSHTSNPQYLITTTTATKCCFLLTQNSREDMDDLGLYVLKVPKGTSTKLQELKAEDILAKAAFESNKYAFVEASLAADSCYIVVPCSFEPGFSCAFTITISTLTAEVTCREMSDSPAVSLIGEWNENTAGGCFNHSSWKRNEQYALTVTESMDVTIKLALLPTLSSTETPTLGRLNDADSESSIGFYVAKPRDYRLEILKRDCILTKSGFIKSSSVSLTTHLPKSDCPYIIIPCTFEAGVERRFELTVFSMGQTALPTLQVCQGLQKHQITGSWDSTSAGGCLNYSSWRFNTQYLLEVDGPTSDVSIVLSQTDQASQSKSIGFYVVEAPEFNSDLDVGMVWAMTSKDVVAKAAFRKTEEVYHTVHLAKGRYIIIPCCFYAGKQGDFQVTVLSQHDVNVSLTEIEDTHSHVIEDEWTEVSAGGCLNNSTFMNNPHFKLHVRKTTKIGVVLAHSGADAGSTSEFEALGCYVTKSNGYGYPLLEAHSDLIHNSNFELGRDTYTEFTLTESDVPYVITPCTFYADKPGSFELRIYTEPQAWGYVWLSSSEPGVYDSDYDGEDEELDEELGDVVVAEQEATPTQEKVPSSPEKDEQEVPPTKDEASTPKDEVQPTADEKESTAKQETEEAAQPTIEITSDTTEAEKDASKAPSVPTEGAQSSEKKEVTDEPKGEVKTTSTATPPPPPPPTPSLSLPANAKSNVSTLQSALSTGVTLRACKSPRKVKSIEPRDSLLQGIRSGVKLKRASARKLAPKPAPSMTLTFNMDKIMARREAMEYSDNEDEDEWSDEDF